MKKASYILMILFLTAMNLISVHADEIKAQLILETTSSELIEGDLIKGKMTIWPIENANLEEFKKLHMQDFMTSLKLVEIESLKTSENNVDVVELDGIFVVKGTQFSRQMNLTYMGTPFVLTSPDYKIKKLASKKEDFEILVQPIYEKSTKWFFIIIFLVLVIVLFVYRKKIQSQMKYFKNRESNRKKKYYQELFVKAQVREDFEHIYLVKEEWLSLLSERTPSHENFLKTINMHQYKKNWERGELEEVKISFDYIRSSFSK